MISYRDAPILVSFTKPLIPKVDGNRYERYFQKAGIFDEGHEIPEINNNGTETKTNSRKQDSLSFTKKDIDIAKKMQESNNGTIKRIRSLGFHSCIILKNFGTIQST